MYEDAPRPTPEAGEVLIGIYAAGVNPMDWKVREGYHRQMINYLLPMMPGWDLSGVVETTGGVLPVSKRAMRCTADPTLLGMAPMQSTSL